MQYVSVSVTPFENSWSEHSSSSSKLYGSYEKVVNVDSSWFIFHLATASSLHEIPVIPD